MTRLFAITRDYGSGFIAGQALEAQPDWPAHARFMDKLEAEDVIVLAGPLGETEDVLMVARAQDAGDIERRLAEDPWTANRVLVTRRIAEWTLRIGSLG